MKKYLKYGKNKAQITIKIRMNAKEKIAFVKDEIMEKAEISPSGIFFMDLTTIYDLMANFGIPDDAPVMISAKEQWSIMQKLEEEGFIKNLKLDENRKGVWLEFIKIENTTEEKKEERSSYSDLIKSVDDLLINLEIRNRCLKIISNFGELKKGQTYKTSIIESDQYGSFQPYEIILLLKELGLIKEIDFKGFYNQNSYKGVGKRRLEFTFEADGIIDFVNKTNGKNSVIKKQALEFIARHIADLKSGNDLAGFLRDLGVPDSLIVYPNTKWRMLNDVLLYYASRPKLQDRKILAEIIEQASHPLMHNGDRNLAEETRKKLNGFLQYDNFSIDENFTLWKEVEDSAGVPSWYDKNGNEIETPVYMIYADKTTLVYTYWNELIKLTKFYFNNKDIQDDEINHIYFEIIKKVENTLYLKEGCGILKKLYERPFGNMIGCEFELQKKGLTPDGLLVKLYDFLNEITGISLPSKNDIEKLKNEEADFFIKINKYIAEKTVKKEATQEIKHTKQEPIPFMLVNDIGIRGLEKGLEAIAKNSKKADGAKFPHKLPSGTKWENITIKFEDDSKVFIKAKQLEHYTNYKDMGFIGKGNNPEPSEAWVFLRVLSMTKTPGEIAITDKDVRDKWKAQKSILSEALQSYFSIDYDPFYPYRSSTEKIGSSYKIKLNLVPPPEQEATEEPEEKDEVKEFLNQEAPQVFEE